MKNRMKKILTLAVAGCMVCSLAACGSSGSGESTEEEEVAAADSVEEVTDAEEAADEEQEEGSAHAGEPVEDTGVVYKVGICNYVNDPSLEQIENAIGAELDAQGPELGVTFSYEDYSFNGQGDQTNLNSIGAQLVAEDVDIIIAIATPTALVMQNATADTDIPVVFSAVSDPVGSDLVASMDEPGGSITGTSDALATEDIFNIILALDPDVTNVGLLYDSSQDSSTQAIADAKAYLDEAGITYTEKTGTTTDDLSLAADSLIASGCEGGCTPTDNTVLVAEPSIYQKFIDAGVKHYCGADSFALVGAFCGYGVDYENLGTMTADMVIDILYGEQDPATTPVMTFDNGKASINTDTCESLGLDYDEISETFAPLCTAVEPLTTSTSFEEE